MIACLAKRGLKCVDGHASRRLDVRVAVWIRGITSHGERLVELGCAQQADSEGEHVGASAPGRPVSRTYLRFVDELGSRRVEGRLGVQSLAGCRADLPSSRTAGAHRGHSSWRGTTARELPVQHSQTRTIHLQSEWVHDRRLAGGPAATLRPCVAPTSEGARVRRVVGAPQTADRLTGPHGETRSSCRSDRPHRGARSPRRPRCKTAPGRVASP
jgi:hypothetical protein